MDVAGTVEVGEEDVGVADVDDALVVGTLVVVEVDGAWLVVADELGACVVAG